MVIVPKRNGYVRICVYLIPLNNAMKKGNQPKANVEHNLVKMKDGKIFTKLDFISGFWQIPFDKLS